MYKGDDLCASFSASFLRRSGWLLATRAEGRLRKFGQVLAIWAFIIAAFIPLGGAYVTLAELCPMGGMIDQMHALPEP